MIQSVHGNAQLWQNSNSCIFHHLLETRFYAPLESAVGRLGGTDGGIHPLELVGKEEEDHRRCTVYAADLKSYLEDPGICVIQVKGTGMDGHWGFHGTETPLDAPPSIVPVAINPASRRQQMIDWPKFFPREEDVPRYAVTSTVALFLKADHIIDIVPQPQKEFAVLACYGDGEVHPALPSSALKGHSSAQSFLTADSAGALLEFRELKKHSQQARLPAGTIQRLESYWTDGASPIEAANNIREMRAVLDGVPAIPPARKPEGRRGMGPGDSGLQHEADVQTGRGEVSATTWLVTQLRLLRVNRWTMPAT